MPGVDNPPPVPARWTAVLLGLSLALLFGCGLLLLERSRAPSVARILADPALRRAALAEIVRTSRGGNDSHPDADVARVLVPGTTGNDGHIDVQTNRFGMREREYVLPKPAGLVRVVVLGDSYVYGVNCPAEQRLGEFLERDLEARSAARAHEIEVLHLGVPSWDLISECSFLRRQLDQLRPDLVVQVTCINDLYDVCGVRG